MKKTFAAIIFSGLCAISAQPAPAASDDEMVASLLANNPFDGSIKGSIAEAAGVSFRSVMFMEGDWHFSIVNKDGRSAWLKLNEDGKAFPCKLTEFDKETMTVKALVNGRSYDLNMDDRASFASKKMQLAEGILPNYTMPRTPAERAELWKYASESQILAANNIKAAAEKQGRPLNREDYRKIMAIERQIKVPEGVKIGGSGGASGATGMGARPRSGTGSSGTGSRSGNGTSSRSRSQR